MRGAWVFAALLPGAVEAQVAGGEAPLPALPGLAESGAAAVKVPLHAPVPVMEMMAAAHWVVQLVSVILGLGLFAVVTVLIFKLGEFWLVGHRLRASLAVVARAETLAEAGRLLKGRRCAGAAMAEAAVEEVALMPPGPMAVSAMLSAGVRARVQARIDRVAGRATARLRRGTGVLATVAATAPFIGLFGTVWGIMSSFLAISAEGTTNLAVVAPGIAEALLVTGFGLVAAIPAIVVLNAVQRRVAVLRQGMADMAVALEVLLSRDLDRRAAA